MKAIIAFRVLKTAATGLASTAQAFPCSVLHQRCIAPCRAQISTHAASACTSICGGANSPIDRCLPNNEISTGLHPKKPGSSRSRASQPRPFSSCGSRADPERRGLWQRVGTRREAGLGL